MPHSQLTYDVSIDQGGVGSSKSGPLFERYAVGLSGVLDRRWAGCYARVLAEAPAFARFQLEPAESRITFMCRTTDGPVQVLSVMNRLEALLERVNAEATAQAAREAVASQRAPADSADMREKSAGQAEAREKAATSAGGGLLARLLKTGGI